MQHRNIGAAIAQQFGDFERTHGHDAAGDDQHILAVAQQLGFAQFEAIVVLVQHQRHLAAQQAHVDRPVVLNHGRDSLGCV
ncbi:hypothetical protein D3C81_2138600 [compost metagenome]